MSSAASVSLIISTYNWPSALALVINSVIQQQILPSEIIIADDGSTIETRTLISDLIKKSPIPIQYVWQQDLGFRLAQSRNNALKVARSDYIIFIDGDTILHPKFIQDHLYYREKNTFVVGSRVLLDAKGTEQFLNAQSFKFNFFTSNVSNRQNAFYSRLLCSLIVQKKKVPIEKLIFMVRGCNFACHYQDIIEINGFNEDFHGWGREDSEFALRLLKKGLWMKKIKFNAIQYHLHHPENNKQSLEKNHMLLSEFQKNHSYQCHNGLIKIPNE